VLLGVKDGLYGDFGGGCKMRNGEKPFECAHREFTEETLGLLHLEPRNITHVFISGTKKPHQTVLMVKVEEGEYFGQDLVYKYESAAGPKELSAIRYVSFSDFQRMPTRYFDVNMKNILGDVRRVMEAMTL
jgi:8-oxo-dGTP pyrophosphatase MutT (NUDIX family)